MQKLSRTGNNVEPHKFPSPDRRGKRTMVFVYGKKRRLISKGNKPLHKGEYKEKGSIVVEWNPFSSASDDCVQSVLLHTRIISILISEIT